MTLPSENFTKKDHCLLHFPRWIASDTCPTWELIYLFIYLNLLIYLFCDAKRILVVFLNLFQHGNCKSSPRYQIPPSDTTAVHSMTCASCCSLSFFGHPIISSAASDHPGFCQALQQLLCLSPCCPLLSIAVPWISHMQDLQLSVLHIIL